MKTNFVWAAPKSTFFNESNPWSKYAEQWRFDRTFDSTLKYIECQMSMGQRVIISIPATKMGLRVLKKFQQLNGDFEFHFYMNEPVGPIAHEMFTIMREEGWTMICAAELTELLKKEMGEMA